MLEQTIQTIQLLGELTTNFVDSGFNLLVIVLSVALVTALGSWIVKVVKQLFK